MGGYDQYNKWRRGLSSACLKNGRNLGEEVVRRQVQALRPRVPREIAARIGLFLDGEMAMVSAAGLRRWQIQTEGEDLAEWVNDAIMEAQEGASVFRGDWHTFLGESWGWSVPPRREAVGVCQRILEKHGFLVSLWCVENPVSGQLEVDDLVVKAEGSVVCAVGYGFDDLSASAEKALLRAMNSGRAQRLFPATRS